MKLGCEPSESGRPEVLVYIYIYIYIYIQHQSLTCDSLLHQMSSVSLLCFDASMLNGPPRKSSTGLRHRVEMAFQY